MSFASLLLENGTGSLLLEDGTSFFLLETSIGSRPGVGGAGKGRNLTLKQKKKLKAVLNQEWLQAENTVQNLLLDRLAHKEPAKVLVSNLTLPPSLSDVIETLKQFIPEKQSTDDKVSEVVQEQTKSLSDVIEALKALSKEVVTLPEQQVAIKTSEKGIETKLAKSTAKVETIEEKITKIEKRLVDLEEMVLVVMSEIM